MDLLGHDHHQGSVRYQIAKAQINQLFLKWVSLPQNDALLKNLISDVKSDHPSPTLTQPPAPNFTKMMQKQPGSPTQKGLTPPRSPSVKEGRFGITMNPKANSKLFDEFWNPNGGLNLDEEPAPNEQMGRAGIAFADPYKPSFSKTDVSALKKLNGDLGPFDNGVQPKPGKNSSVLDRSQEQDPERKGASKFKLEDVDNRRPEEVKTPTMMEKIKPRGDKAPAEISPSKEGMINRSKTTQVEQKKVVRENIPQFYYPNGKPLSVDDRKKNSAEIDKLFTGKADGKLAEADFEAFTGDVLKIPKIFQKSVFEACRVSEKLEGAEKIPKLNLVNFFNKHFEADTPKKRCFKLLVMQTKPVERMVIEKDDFKHLFKYLLEKHQGLEFLQATPEFQERYSDTVVMRIFYLIDSNDDGKISWRDFK